MGLFICGINHKHADLALREQCAVSEDSLPHMLRTLISLPAIEEAGAFDLQPLKSSV